MNVPFILRSLPILLSVLTTISGFSQDLPAIRPAVDPGFWGRTNEPYTLKLTQTNTSVNGSDAPQTRVSQTNVYRDSAGRVRTEDFYDNGQPMAVGIRDPGKDTFTIMHVVNKSAYIMSTPRLASPPPGKGWTVERLPPRVIAGFPAEGLRFTRITAAAADGTAPPDTLVDEEWISNTLGIVLEQTIESRRTGTTTKTVSHVEQREPDPTLFTIPPEYSVQQAVPHPQ